jgi:hypothetical protein
MWRTAYNQYTQVVAVRHMNNYNHYFSVAPHAATILLKYNEDAAFCGSCSTNVKKISS